MDIGSGNGYPSAALSNFAPHPFVIDGVECASMEGFLQSLKFESVDMQRYVCTLVGKAAKKKGHKKNWYQKQELYWNGQTYKEHYQPGINIGYTYQWRKRWEHCVTSRVTCGENGMRKMQIRLKWLLNILV